MNQFPGNSHKAQGPQKPDKPQKEVKRVISGEAITRKKPLGKRFKETFFGGDGRSAADYFFNEVIVPGSKAMLIDGVNGAMQRMLGVEGSYPNRGPGARVGFLGGLVGHTDYRGMSNRGAPWREDPRSTPGEPLSRHARSTHNFNEIVLGSRAEAEAVLDEMFRVVNEYNFVSLSDLYTMVNITPDFTDEKWGWSDLSHAGVSMLTSGGYLLNLPRPEPFR